MSGASENSGIGTILDINAFRIPHHPIDESFFYNLNILFDKACRSERLKPVNGGGVSLIFVISGSLSVNN